MVMHYRDHHKMIKAIEKCSLQATFDQDITSTNELLPRECENSSVVTLEACPDSGINIIEKRTGFNKIPIFSARPCNNTGILHVHSINNDNNVTSNLIENDGSMPLVLTGQDKNISSNRVANDSSIPTVSTSVCGNMPAVVVGEDGMVPYQQSNFLGRVPLEVWGQKVSYRASRFLSVTFTNSFSCH